MILKTIKILPILIGVNTTPILEQPKKATTQDFALTLSNRTYTSVSDYDLDDFEGMVKYSAKVEENGYNSALMVNEYQYISTLLEDSLDYVYIPHLTGVQNMTDMILAYQITPYRQMYDTSENIPLTINVYPNTNLSDVYTELTIDIKTITSVESSWATYMDLSSYSTVGLNQSIYEDLTDEENGFVYTSQEQTITYTEDSTSATQEIEIEIEIVPNETNYIYIYLQPYINTSTGSTYSEYNLVDATSYSLNWVYVSGTTFTGVEIVGNYEQEVIDVPSLLWEVLTMPFTFISVAFNLTLYPGTPYQINISNLFLSIIAMLVFIAIIKVLLRMKG